MELLTIRHTDFTMTIECAKFDAVWGKAVRNIGEQELQSVYSWSDGVVSVTRQLEDGELAIEQGGKAPAIFFDNTDYPIWAEFADYVKDAQFGAALQDDNERFSFRKHILAGFLNYGNDIGRSEIVLVYQVGNDMRRFTFSFDVLSTKLNYHEHWRGIIEDIEREYRMLSLDYMRRTFHGFAPDPKGETPEIVWWSVFQEEQDRFIRACKSIIDRPQHRLHGREGYKRAARLTFVPASIENELSEHKREEAHLYRMEEQVQTNDTQENRFLKFAIGQIAAKYESLKKRIESLNNVSDIKKTEMAAVYQKLRRLQRNPFFRTVGRYKGMNQESLVLHKATGYSQVYRTWNLLRRGYSLQDGLYRLQTKDIATLYEIWCFIEVSHIVKEQLRLEDVDIDHRNRMELSGMFTWELGKGEHSRILFRKDGVELAELVYNPKNSEEENSDIGMSNLVVPTVPQKPDIVLQLTKNDLQQGMKMTYLFDAKYRIAGRQNGVDTPPDDAINQMHRYRDAIYYKDYPNKALKKEVIGGYILFPGDGEPLDVAQAKFYKTIREVNIGAFPLRPKDKRNRELLADFIGKIIEMKSQETISNVIPQKGTFVDVGDRVLIGVIGKNSRKDYVKSFESGTATLYYTGRNFPTTIALQGLHFFIPYLKGKGIRDVYEITRMRTITAKEAKQDEDEGEDLRLAFELRFSHRLYMDYRKIDTSRMINYTFIDTLFDNLENMCSNDDCEE